MITKEQRVAASVRQRIVDGVWSPGSPLPTFTQLEQQYPASRLTLQRAMQRLKQQNFIVTRERQGMCVAERPPHLNRYGIVLAYHERHNAFWSALLHDAAELGEQTGSEFVAFRGLANSNFDPAEWERLRQDIEEHCLAGLFTVCTLTDSPAYSELAKAKLPVVGLTSTLKPTDVRLRLDNRSFMDRALDWFATQGRRRIALLTRGLANAPQLKIFDDAVQEYPQVISPSAWRHSVFDCAQAEPLVELLLSLPTGERPDGLLIGDDNLLDPAARAVIASGLKLPDELSILSHCNWSIPVSCPLPIMRLGFETKAVVKRAVELIDALRQGASTLPDAVIPAVFESELSHVSTSAANQAEPFTSFVP